MEKWKFGKTGKFGEKNVEKKTFFRAFATRAKKEPEAQGHDSTFTFRHAQLEKAILLLKRPKVPKLFLSNDYIQI